MPAHSVFDPSNANYNDTSMLGDCTCISMADGVYTVVHTEGTTVCGICSKHNQGYAYSDPAAHVFANVGTHTYAEGVSVCTNCRVVTATIDGVEYTELSAALAAAANTDTVVLVKDVAVNGNADIYCTLDLNGNNLNASGVVDAANDYASITDSVGTGTATGSSVTMMPGNSQLAIDSANNGTYSYETVQVKQKKTVVDADNTFVMFYINKEAASTQLDDAIRAGSDVKVRITVASEAIDGGRHSFVYGEDLVDQYIADWDNKMFTCGISGLAELGEYTITAEVVSGGVVVEAVTAAKNRFSFIVFGRRFERLPIFCKDKYSMKNTENL